MRASLAKIEIWMSFCGNTKDHSYHLYFRHVMFISYYIDERCCTEINDSCENELKKYCTKEIFVRYRHMTKLFFNICSCKLLKANTKNLLIICKTRKCTKMTNEFWEMTKKEKYKCIFSGNGNITMALGIP